MTEPEPDDQPWARRDTGPRGLQRERTMLAWNRTMLALVVTAVLLMRAGGPPYLRALHLPGAAVLLVAGWLWFASDLRYRRPLDPARTVKAAPMALLAGASMLVGVAGILVLARS